MKDVAVSLAIFLAICTGLAFLLLALSNWHRWIDKRLRPKYPTINRADLEAEAANAECGLYSLPDHIRHRNKFEGRHYDAA